MRRLEQLLGVTLLLFTACKSYDSINIDNNVPEIIFEINKRGCYGSCPIYNITLYSDLKVKYSGEKFIENIGQFEWSISKEDFQNITDIIVKTFNQSKSYNTYVQDLPLTTLKIWKEIKIEFKGACPKEFKKEFLEIEQKILKNSKWK